MLLFFILIRISTSQEFKDDNEYSKSKWNTTSNVNKLSSLENSEEDEIDIEELLFYLDDKPNSSKSSSNILQVTSIDSLSSNCNSNGIKSNLEKEFINLESSSTCSKNLPSYSQNMISNIEDINSDSEKEFIYLQNVPTNLQDLPSNSQNVIPYLEDINFDLEKEFINLQNAPTNLQDLHYNLQNMIPYLEDINFDLETEFVNIQNEPTNSQDLPSNSQDIISHLEDINYDLNNELPNFHDLIANSQDISYNLQRDTQNMHSLTHNLKYFTPQLQNIGKNLSYISHELNILSNESEKLSSLRDDSFDMLEESDGFDSDSDSHYSLHLENESSSDSSSDLDPDYCVKQNKNTCKRKFRGKTKHPRKKKKVCRKSKAKSLRDKNKRNDSDNSKDYVEDEDIFQSMRKFFKVLAKYVFKMELNQMSEYVIPAFRDIFNVLGKNYNESINLFNSYTSSLEELIECELKNVNDRVLMKIKTQCNAIINNKHNDPKNAVAISQSIYSKIKWSFSKRNEIRDALNTCISNFNNLKKKIISENKIINKLPKITYDFTYNHLTCFKSIYTSDHCYNYNQILDSMEDFINYIEISIKKGIMPDDYVKISYIRKGIISVTNNLRNTQKILKVSLNHLKNLDLSPKDHETKIKIIFHFVNEVNKNNSKKLEKMMKNHGQLEIIYAIYDILLKEAKYILESRDRVSRVFNINVSDLNLNKTRLNKLLKNRDMKLRLYNLYKNIIRLVKYESLNYQLSLIKYLYISLKKLLLTRNKKLRIKKAFMTSNKQRQMNSELKNIKKLFREVKLNVKCRGIYSMLKEIILEYSKLWKSLEENIDRNLSILETINSVINDDLSKTNRKKGNEVSNEGILFLLYYVKEAMFKYS
ncbi:surface-associated interspersed protein (SURFIN) [Plasmodium gallinaceum]|uniref:Surface-associated interspersed protein (SURFIN) n=1 Tax=Plasmodium gallinaceum TaxID=5849 RepID=A0A1J1GXI2_PLAGA|nr:surface-associated interspersed protein (SURFIN) [Plasmodium gallinaceum]CRG95997.1 surface-associated interspersed protein (SURFIN) [Plasmodium gallinaceum]